ncbi:SDR family NAD(P)-dependent oxidoreductase [Paenibacillus azoreducens]|uniref:3-oxoacyl-ACP reductase n=1 Tax=Paenibacillus azoreducens TaxID=116718 RepID=A0A919YG05_9BACL|nr:glucose 1-dehydrogenase [Paenibacillus azoreducens]GIO48485.1 3-oxoacyl-ACP reductase [Paenibacillus azoreducens]
MTIELLGKIALVTGASAGIGRQIAETLAAAGAAVAVHYRKGKEEAEAAVASIIQAGGRAAACYADVTKVGDITSMVEEIEAKLGGSIDILVNNAGDLISRVPNTEMTEEHYTRVMDVNFKSCVFMNKLVIPGMIAKGAGKIIHLTSVAAHDGGGPGASIYAASKAAVMAYAKGLAKEVAPHGINVNCISPGFIGRTAFHATHTSNEGRQATVAKIPLGREGTPQDVADAALYLASSLSDFLTGETIEVNGGLFMR